MSSDCKRFYRYRTLFSGRSDVTHYYRAVAAVKRVGDNYEVAFSFCAPQDQFKKSFGKKIADGRLERGRKVFVTPEEVEEHKGVFEAAIYSIFNSYEKQPLWVPERLWVAGQLDDLEIH
jgi:hypothetical protein